MRITFLAAIALSLLAGCPSPAPAGAGSTTASSAEPAPLRCAAGAYTHTAPDFCLELPAGARGVAPKAATDFVSFPGLVVTWTPRSNAALVASWKKPAPHPGDKGTFEVLSTEPMERGTFFMVHDATQDPRGEMYIMPRLMGVAVVEGSAFALKCTATRNLEQNEDPRKVAAAHAAELAACKTLRVR